MKTAFYSKVGTVLKMNGHLYMVTRHALKTTLKGRGKGFLVQLRMKDLIHGNMVEETLDSEDKVDDVTLERAKFEFLYEDQGNFAFMNQETYDQIELSAEDIGDGVQFLVPGAIVDLQQFEGRFVGIVLPLNVKLKVTEADPGVKGNTADGKVVKDAMLETGYRLKVPGFVEEGEYIIVNTETGEYSERAKD